MESQPASKPRLSSSLWIALFLVAILTSGGAFFCFVPPFAKQPSETAGGKSTAHDQPGAADAGFRSPSTADYVGSEACAGCHGEIAAAFKTHPMSRSLRRVGDDAEEAVDEHNRTRVAGTQRVLEAEIKAAVMVHHERMFDRAGEIIYDQAVPMDYVVGSGRRAKAYLYRRGNLLFMSPLNWYSQSQQWDLAPGYRKDDARRFDRRVTDECLSCHAGRVAPLGESANAYETPAFHELSIGCENCHGPGRRHVELRQSDPAAGRDLDSIVNPARLDHARRESICNQCHLPGAARVLRYGRSDFDFRPGDDLEDIWTVIEEGGGVTNGDRTRSVSHVQQMHESRCYSKSAGGLGCSSCHDPHRVPPPTEYAAFYRKKCLHCHADRSCSAPSEQRQARADSCIACHMPTREASNVSHVTQTDHRIVREAGQASDKQPDDNAAGLSAFNRADLRLNAWERDRALGLAAWKHLSRKGRQRPAELISFLTGVLEKGPKDGTVLIALGSMASENGLVDRARSYYERARRIPDAEEAALSGLLDIDYLASRRRDALDCADRLIEIDAGDARVHAIRADILATLGRQPEGIEAARRALQLNPTLVPVRQWLINALREAGRGDEQREQELILRRMKDAAPPPD